MLEQARVAHEGGSSYGKSRMYREMYSDAYFSKMQVRHGAYFGSYVLDVLSVRLVRAPQGPWAKPADCWPHNF